MSSYCLESIKSKNTFLLLIELIKCLIISPQMLNKQNILGANFLYFPFFINKKLLICVLLRFFHCICIFYFLTASLELHQSLKKDIAFVLIEKMTSSFCTIAYTYSIPNA